MLCNIRVIWQQISMINECEIGDADNECEKEQALTAHKIDFTAEAQAASVMFMALKRFCSCKSLDESQQTLPLYEQKARGFFGVTGAPVYVPFSSQNHIQ